MNKAEAKVEELVLVEDKPKKTKKSKTTKSSSSSSVSDEEVPDSK